MGCGEDDNEGIGARARGGGLTCVEQNGLAWMTDFREEKKLVDALVVVELLPLRAPKTTTTFFRLRSNCNSCDDDDSSSPTISRGLAAAPIAHASVRRKSREERGDDGSPFLRC